MTMMNTLKVVAAAAALLSLQGCFNSEIKTAKEHQEAQFGKLGDILESRTYCSDQKWTTRDEPDKSVTVINTCTVKLSPEVFQEGILNARESIEKSFNKNQDNLRGGLADSKRIMAIIRRDDPTVDLERPVNVRSMGRYFSDPVEDIRRQGPEFAERQQKELEAWESAQESGMAKINECHQQDSKILEDRINAKVSARLDEIVEIYVKEKQVKIRSFDMQFDGQSSKLDAFTQFQRMMPLLSRNWTGMSQQWGSVATENLLSDLPQKCKYLPPSLT